MKRDSTSVYIEIRLDTPLPLHVPVYIFLTSLHSPSCVRIKWMSYFSTKKQIFQVSYSLKNKHAKKNLYRKINGSTMK